MRYKPLVIDINFMVSSTASYWDLRKAYGDTPITAEMFIDLNDEVKIFCGKKVLTYDSTDRSSAIAEKHKILEVCVEVVIPQEYTKGIYFRRKKEKELYITYVDQYKSNNKMLSCHDWQIVYWWLRRFITNRCSEYNYISTAYEKRVDAAHEEFLKRKSAL